MNKRLLISIGLVMTCASGLLATGCAGATKTADTQKARAELIKIKEEAGYPFKVTPTGDASLDGIVGLFTQLANEKVQQEEKIVAAASNPQFGMIDQRMEAVLKEKKLSNPTLEERQQVRAEVSKGLSAEDRTELTRACSKYDEAATAYRKNNDANMKALAKATADLAAKAAIIKEGGTAGAATVGLSMFGVGEKLPLALAYEQTDRATEVIELANKIIDANESRATEMLAMANLDGTT